MLGMFEVMSMRAHTHTHTPINLWISDQSQGSHTKKLQLSV